MELLRFLITKVVIPSYTPPMASSFLHEFSSQTYLTLSLCRIPSAQRQIGVFKDARRPKVPATQEKRRSDFCGSRWNGGRCRDLTCDDFDDGQRRRAHESRWT
jgi:hypothetical protein